MKPITPRRIISSTKVARKFNFKAFSRLILIRISIELQLIDIFGL